MSIIQPEIEIVDRTGYSIRYLEHGWPTNLCRWHAHEEYELHLILETRGRTFIGDYIGEFQPGSLYLTGPNLPHNWVTHRSQSDRVKVRDMLIQFDHKSLMNLMNAFPEFREIRSLLELSNSGVEFINFDWRAAYDALAGLKHISGAQRIISFLDLLLRLNAHKSKRSLSVVKITQARGNQKQLRIGEVIDHVTRNYPRRLSLSTAAAMAGMSEASFSRNFQLTTGNRFVEFVNRVRIGQACIQLLETNEQISRICFDVGFQNLANFNRHFLAMKGVTPSKYRRAAKSDLS